MKQLKNDVSILTGSKSRIGERSTLPLAAKGAKENPMLKKKSKPQREYIFIKAPHPTPVNTESTVIQPAKPSLIDIVGTVSLVVIILTILILFLFFGNGIHVAKPLLR